MTEEERINEATTRNSLVRWVLAALFGLIAISNLGGYFMSVKFDLVDKIFTPVYASLSLATMIYFCRPKAAWDAAIRCPCCGKEDGTVRSVVNDMRLTGRRWFFLGAVVGTISVGCRRVAFDCRRCGRSFEKRTFSRALALCWLIAICAAFVCQFAGRVR